MKIHNIGDYYLQDGVFILKSPWSKRFKLILLSVISALVLIPTEMPSAAQIEKAIFNLPKSKEQLMVEYIQETNENVSKNDARKIVQSIMKYSSEFDITPELMLAIGKVESSFNKYAISNAGALGVFQIIPSWHNDKLKAAKSEIGTPEPFAIETNTYIGMWVLKDCMTKWKSLQQSLLCYNGSNAKPNGYDQKVISALKEIKSYI